MLESFQSSHTDECDWRLRPPLARWKPTKRVQIIRNSPSLESEVKERLIKLTGSRVTDDGILIIEAKKYRTQEQNRYDATQRLIAWVQKALEKPKVRRATRPSLTAKAARVGDKKKRGEIKKTRRFNQEDWD